MMLEPNALADVSDETLEDEMLNRPISSIRDLQYVYGKLFELAVMDLDSPASRYRTFEDNKLTGKQSHIEISVECDGEDGLTVVDAELKRYEPHVANKVGLCHNSAARGCDNSLSQITSKSGWGDDTIENLIGKFEQWTKQDAVKDALTKEWGGFNATVATSIENTNWDEFEQEVNGKIKLPDDAKKQQLIGSIKFKHGSEYLYPGEVDVCFTALKNKKYSEYTETSIDTGKPSIGDGVCYVTGEEGELVGTMNDPLKHFVSKQQSSFPGMTNNDAWRAHPISFDAAMTIDNSEPFFESLRTWTNNLRAYHLPYPRTNMDASDARLLYNLLQSIYENYENEPDDEYYTGDVAFMRMYNEDIVSNFNVYIIFEHYQQESRRDVFFDEPSGDVHTPSKIAQTHSDIVNEYADSSVIATKADSDKDSLLTANTESLLKQILGGWYFNQTMPQSSDDAPSTSDKTVEIMQSLLSGQPVAVKKLLQEFDTKLKSAWTENARGDDGNKSRVPTVLLSQQTMQFETLARAGLLKTSTNDYIGYTKPNTKMQHDNTQEMIDILSKNGMSKGEQIARKQLADLQQYIEQRPKYFDHAERRSTFLMGVLIGMVSQRQRQDGKSSLTEGIPVHQLSKRQLQNAYSKAIEKNKTYSLEESNYIRYDKIITEIQNSMTTIPTEWEISNEDLRFTFGQGLMYGENYYHNLEYDDSNNLIAVNNESLNN